MPDGMVMDIGRGEAGPVPHSAAPVGAAIPVPGSRLAELKPWMCVNHRADDGARVRLALRREGCEVHWPRIIERLPRRDDVIRPLFRGYMFVQPPACFGPALMREVQGVLGVVGVRERGRPDPCDHLVAHLLARAGSIDGVINETADALPVTKFQRGQPVTVASGPFAGLDGLMKSEDRGQARVRVLLEILGGQREIEVPREAVTELKA